MRCIGKRISRDAGASDSIFRRNTSGDRAGDVAEILAREKLDFVQINYSIMEREAEEKILPSRKSMASPSLLIVLLAAAIFSVASAESRCPISRQSLIALPGRNFF